MSTTDKNYRHHLTALAMPGCVWPLLRLLARLTISCLTAHTSHHIVYQLLFLIVVAVINNVKYLQLSTKTS